MGRSPFELRYENNRIITGESLEEIAEKLDLKAGGKESDDDGGGWPW